MAEAEGQMQQEMDEKQINEEYKIWKKNSPFLYDFVLTHALEWPSLTVDWLPFREEFKDKGVVEQRMVLGTHTSGSEQNYLMVATTRIPHPEAEIDARKYDDEKGELGGFGVPAAKVGITIKMCHDGEVNRAKHCPQNPFLIATKTVSGDVLVFDQTKHPSEPESNECRPQIRCGGHDKEGYGIAWSPQTEGMLLSGSDDGKVLAWDTASAASSAGQDGRLQPVFQGVGVHDAVVEDVDWHPTAKNVVASAGDDRRFVLWDVRQGEKGKATHVGDAAHAGEINSIAFAPLDGHRFATCSADKVVKLWDMRKLDKEMHKLEGHTGEVFQLQWAPFNEAVLASVGADRRAYIWDLSRIGAEQTAEEAEDGPPELLFIHGGHTAKISDLSWNMCDRCEWTLATVAEDNILQIWQVAEQVYASAEEPEDGVGGGAAAGADVE